MPEGHVWLRVRPASGLPRRSLPTPTLFAHALWHGGCLRRPRLPRRVGRSFFRHNHRVERTCASPSQPMSLAFPAIHIFRLAALLCLSASVLICRSWLDFVFAAFRADLGEVLFHVHEIFPLFHRRLTCREFPRFVDFPQLEHSAQNSPLIPSSQAIPPHLHRRQLAAVSFCLGAESVLTSSPA